MEMGSQDAIKSIEPTREIYICPSCNYEDGFHVSFTVKGNSQDGEIVLSGYLESPSNISGVEISSVGARNCL